MDECVFCRIIARLEPADFIEQGARHVAFKPLHPYAPGHVLFVPRRHVADATESFSQTGIIMARAGLYVKYVVKGPANIITSIGAEATQTVFHLHVHVVPRGPEDGLRASWPWRVKPGEELGPGKVV